MRIDSSSREQTDIDIGVPWVLIILPFALGSVVILLRLKVSLDDSGTCNQMLDVYHAVGGDRYWILDNRIPEIAY